MFVDGTGVGTDAEGPVLRRTYSERGDWYASMRTQGRLVEGHELEAAWSATTLLIDEAMALAKRNPKMATAPVHKLTIHERPNKGPPTCRRPI